MSFYVGGDTLNLLLMYGFFIFPCVVHAKIQRIAEATGNKIADKVTKVSKTHHGLR